MNSNVVVVLVIMVVFSAFYILRALKICTTCNRPGLRKTGVSKTYDYGQAQQAEFECSYCGSKEWKTVNALHDLMDLTGPTTTLRKVRDSRSPTKPRVAESAAEKFKKRKGKRLGAEHPTRVSMKPRPAKPTTQREERNEERLDVPPTEPTPEIQEAPRSKPSWLRDTSDIRRAIIQAEILQRPHPRRIGKRRP